MKMHVITTELGDDWAGPYTDLGLLQKTLAIIRKMDPMAEVASRETDPYSEQIRDGLLPYHIHVNLIDGEPQLPAEISMTWPPEEQEGIVLGTEEATDFFVWAKGERDALLRLARLNGTRKEAGRATA
jgi:hypothetical protein